MNRNALFDAVDRHNAAEYDGDLAATMATVGPNPVFDIYPLGLHLTSRKDVESYYRGLFDAGFKHYDANIRNRWAVDAETVVVEVDVEVWIEGGFMGIKIPERRKVKIPQIAILTIRNGLVDRERSYFDILSIQQQLNAEETGAAADKARADANKAATRALFDAMNAFDLDRVRSFFSDDVAYELPYHPTTSPLSGTVNLAGLMELYGSVGRMMPAGLRFAIGTMTAEDDRVAVEAESHSDTPLGEFHNRYHFLLRFHDGKIIEGKEYADSAMMANFAQRAAASGNTDR